MDYNFSDLSPTFNELAINLAIILFIPFILVMILKFVLLKMRIPNNIASTLSSLCFLVGAYYMFDMVF
ncbi:hypothetical protein P6709_02120 [Jeotgalibacillus sp. ET6]|uniref:hypothetical protein n=1 Tax=Jeotgalibacillus sp. ET6 TaxID=3037260 RepID=UPI0024185721|nr:hypothetical protein [Jeotgalibacillus sp. ET6]MDG5470525.1 hypothetical protein [Jeotgalibacillus sp. ET6]